MAHLKSTKSTTVPIRQTLDIECKPEIEIGILQKPDGSYAAYGRHLFPEMMTDENNEVVLKEIHTMPPCPCGCWQEMLRQTLVL